MAIGGCEVSYCFLNKVQKRIGQFSPLFFKQSAKKNRTLVCCFLFIVSFENLIPTLSVLT